MEPPLFHSPSTMVKRDNEPSSSMCKTILEKLLLDLGNETHWSQIFLSLVESPLWSQVPMTVLILLGIMPQPRGPSGG